MVKYVKLLAKHIGKIFYKEKRIPNSKYLHLLMQNDIKFFKSLIIEMNKNAKDFFPHEHIFVTPYWNVYYELKGYTNIFYIRNINGDFLEYLENNAAWIFIHALNFSLDELRCFSKKLRERIIWRTWGHDVPSTIDFQSSDDLEWIDIVSDFYSICGGSLIDKCNLERYIKIKNFFVLPYCFDDMYLRNNTKKHEGINILLGHSGYPSENIIENIKRLEHFSNNNLIVNIILSYGDKIYIEKVEKYVREESKLTFNIVKEFMPMKEYVSFLQEMDIAIMDQIKSAALGNIEWLLSFDVKMFVNKNGVFHEAFNRYKVKHCTTDLILNMSFEDFTEKLNNDPDKVKVLAHHDKIENIEMWKSLLHSLD